MDSSILMWCAHSSQMDKNVLMETTALRPILESSSCISLKPTKRNSVLTTRTTSINVNTEIIVLLPTVRKKSGFNSSTTMSSMKTSTCSTIKPSFVPSISPNMINHYACMLIIFKITAGILQTITTNQLHASIGNWRTTSMIMMWGAKMVLIVICAMVGNNYNFTLVSIIPKNAWRKDAREESAQITILKNKKELSHKLLKIIVLD